MLDLIAQEEVSRLVPLDKLLDEVLRTDISKVRECHVSRYLYDKLHERKPRLDYPEYLMSLYDLTWSTMICTSVLDYVDVFIKSAYLFSVMYPSLEPEFNPYVRTYFVGYEEAEQDPLFLLFTQYQEDIRDLVLKKPVTPASENRVRLCLEQCMSVAQVVLDTLGESDFEKFKQVVDIYFDALDKQ